MFRTRTHVGVYVDDAPGPIARALAIVPHLRSQVTLLSSADPRDLPVGDHALRLPLRAPNRVASGGPEDSGELSTSPVVPPSLGAAGAAELVAWMEQESPDLVFVDGPSDVAIFTRLIGGSVVALKRHGRRTPAQQLLIDRTAIGMLAPYPEDLAAPDEAPSDRTVHVGLMTPSAGRSLTRQEARRDLGLTDDQRLVTVLGGGRGLTASEADLAAAAAATATWRWHLLGDRGATGTTRHASVRDFGWVADPCPHLVASDVVVAGGSPSAVAAVAAAGVPLIVIPRPSADREERRFADALAAVGAAVPLSQWPAPARWEATLEAASRVDPRPLASRSDPRAGRRASEWLDAWAAMPTTPGHQPAVAGELQALLQEELVVDGKAASTS